MPQMTPENPEEIDISNSNNKRVLGANAALVCNPSDLTSPPKKQKIDSGEIIRSAPFIHTKEKEVEVVFKTTIDRPNQVDPSELASAFALASLANLSPGRTGSSAANKEESRDVTRKDTHDQKHDGVRNMESWEETRSPKADHHPYSPEQRSPGSAPGIQDTPPSKMSLEDRSTSGGSRKVTFAPNTKETSCTSTPLRVRLAASRRLTMPSNRAPMLSHSNDSDMIVSPRPHRLYGGMPPLYVRTPPHMPSTHMRHGPPPPPHQHSTYHHGLLQGHGAFHHPSPQHYGSPGGWHAGPPRNWYPPRHLLQPPLLHRSNERGPPPPTFPSSNEWICDYCNVASFGTYEEACIHEESCKLRVLSMSSSGEDRSISLTQSRSEEEDSAPAEVYSSSPSINVKERDWFNGTMSLAMEDSDRENLSELNCYIRKYCVEMFAATANDVANPLSNRNRITLQQVGVRCCFCANHGTADTLEGGNKDKEHQGEATKASKIAAAVSYPATIAGIYESVKRWQRVHFEICPFVPDDVRDQLSILTNTNVWIPTTRQYWADSARALGLVDTTEGIRFGKDPVKVHDDVRRIANNIHSEEDPSPTSSVSQYSRAMSFVPPPAYPPPSMIQHHHPVPSYVHPGMLRMDHLHQAVRVMSQEGSTLPPPPTPATISVSGSVPHPNLSQQPQHVNASGGFIVYPQDMEMIPPYVFFLMQQVEPCVFTEADRFVARSKGPVGYPGFQCRHCNGHAGLGKYFPVSAKSLSTNSTSQNIHAHLLKCRKCSNDVKDRLVQLKIEKSRAPRLEPGWRKIFFDRVWARLHHPDSKRTTMLMPHLNDETKVATSIRGHDERDIQSNIVGPNDKNHDNVEQES
jgi:hypothetical protein